MLGLSFVGVTSPPSDLGAQLTVESSSTALTMCGLAVVGTVRCWGEHSDSASPAPSGLGLLRAAAGGVYQNCALTASRGVACWGDFVAAAPGQVPADLGPVLQVAPGYRDHCVVKVASQARCWGTGISRDAAVTGTMPSWIGGRSPSVALGASISDSAASFRLTSGALPAG